jgi:hypothetical protein
VVRLAAILGLALALTACAPAMLPTHTRTGDVVVVSITANAPLYQTTVTILDAHTSDLRCTDFGDAVWCFVGDLAAGDTARIEVTGYGVACTAAAYLSADLHLRSYRPFACRAR